MFEKIVVVDSTGLNTWGDGRGRRGGCRRRGAL